MIGSDYESFKEFMNACKYSLQKLEASHVLGKIYLINQLKQLITYCQIDNKITGKIDGDGANRGINNRYAHADAIADILDTKKIGQALSHLDHDFYFPCVSYFLLPKTGPYKSFITFQKILKTEYNMGSKQIKIFFNGIVAPQGSSLRVESIRINQGSRSVSMLLSCNRVLLRPDGQPGNYGDYFLARLPVKANFLFTTRLLEISMPIFAEVQGAALVEASRTPERFQYIIKSFEKYISTKFSGDFLPLDFKKLMLYLEIKLGAEDMGWKIAPQTEAAFDLTQGVLPLKKIFDAFSQSLKEEYDRRKKEYPLSQTNLYNIFRALKENSHTYSLVLQAPLGKKSGKVRVSTYYGNQNSSYAPVILLARNDVYINSRLRDCVEQSQQEIVQNPYDIDYIMSKS